MPALASRPTAGRRSGVRAGRENIVMAPNTLLPTLAMLAAVFLWSSATPGSKFALSEIAVAEFVVIRLSLAAAALWLIVLATRTSAHLRHVGWRPLAGRYLRRQRSAGLLRQRTALTAQRPGRRQPTGDVELAADLGLLRGGAAAVRHAAGRNPRDRCRHAIDRRAAVSRPRRVGRRLYPVELRRASSPRRPHEPAGLPHRTTWRDAVRVPAPHAGEHTGYHRRRPRDIRGGPAVACPAAVSWNNLGAAPLNPTATSSPDRCRTRPCRSASCLARAFRQGRPQSLQRGDGRLVDAPVDALGTAMAL